jgi:hypothetical protein
MRALCISRVEVCLHPKVWPDVLLPLRRKSFVPIYRGQPMLRCGFCGGTFSPEFKGQVCTLCQVCLVCVVVLCVVGVLCVRPFLPSRASQSQRRPRQAGRYAMLRSRTHAKVPIGVG